MEPENRAQKFDRQTRRALGRISEPNLPLVVGMLEDRARAGKRPSSTYSALLNFIRLDGYARKPFADLTAADVAGYLDWYRGLSRSVGSVKTAAIYAQQVCVAARGVESHEDLPPDFRRALKAARPKGNTRGAVIPDAAFLAAIEAVPRLGYELPSAPELIRAFLWTLWDSGMRIAELLSLCISDVTLDHRTGTAKLQLREERVVTHGLKTGAGYVIIRDAVPALKAWLAVHPARHDPEAPLVTALAYYTHPRPLNEDSANRVIEEVFALVGAKPVGKRRKFSCHDFRHTAATRDARNGYREPALRLKYRWSGRSDMPSRYVHLAEEDARALVLQSRPMAPAAVPAGAVDLGAALAAFNAASAALAAAMAAHGGQGAAATSVITSGPPPGAAPAMAVQTRGPAAVTA